MMSPYCDLGVVFDLGLAKMFSPAMFETYFYHKVGLAFATPPPLPRIEIFGVNTLRGKLHQLGSPNLQDIFIGR